MIALLVEINALPLLPVNLYGLDWLWHSSHHLQIALLVAGAALLVYGLDGFPSYRGVTSTLRWLRLRWRSRYTRALIVVTLLALLLRLWNLEYGVHNFIDELLYVNAVVVPTLKDSTQIGRAHV